METKVDQKLIDKFYCGDALTDPELDALIRHTSKLLELLAPMGYRYHLACTEVASLNARLNSYKRYRDLSK